MRVTVVVGGGVLASPALMIRLLLSGLLGLAVLSPAPSSAQSWVQTAGDDYDVQANVIYREVAGWRGMLDIYRPGAGGDAAPTLVWFHGGGWTRGSKEAEFLYVLPYLARGWSVVNVEYRLASAAGAPAAAEDAVCALRWIGAHGRRYGLSLDRLVVSGISAGGHLALMAAFAPADSRLAASCRDTPGVNVTAVVNWFGPSDVAPLLEGPHALPQAVEWFTGRRADEGLIAEVSPITQVRPGLPPVLTVHGTADDEIPYDLSVRLHAALQAAGVPERLVGIEGAAHGAFGPGRTATAYEAIWRFLENPRAAGQVRPPAPLPVIDMHLHAATLEQFGGGGEACVNEGPIWWPALDPARPLMLEHALGCARRLASPATDDAVRDETVAMMERLNIWGVAFGPLDRVRQWQQASPRIIPGVPFTDRDRTPAEYRRLFEQGAFAIFGEITAQYRGLSLADPVYAPYFSLAEQLDIPVGVHLGEGPPGGAHTLGGPGKPSPYRVRLGSPFQLEDVLIKHPRLRLYVMHYGSPLVDEMIAMLFSHPQLYVDIAQNNWGFPREHFHAQLKRLVDAGFGERILFGSDQMVWPGTIEVAIRTIQEAPFLSERQKRDILYHNAARFLRLSQAEIDRHHGR